MALPAAELALPSMASFRIASRSAGIGASWEPDVWGKLRAGVSGALLKSNVSLSGPTKEPFCEASLLTTLCKAQWSRCVTV